VYGECKIGKKNKKIEGVFLEGEDVKGMEEGVEGIEEGDLIVMGRGCLYRSVI
ncbi:2-phospho-L-lactate transferase CofD family protein, partial [Staphylococcus saprophyticus]|uniref:2-phospho-L-lactate transferase CofD family protein n=1 Tax=Staphylococcus saprophyticus TaxID=29385 RepID=UPI0037045198